VAADRRQGQSIRENILFRGDIYAPELAKIPNWVATGIIFVTKKTAEILKIMCT
jgi:hypothetical protein